MKIRKPDKIFRDENTAAYIAIDMFGLSVEHSYKMKSKMRSHFVIKIV